MQTNRAYSSHIFSIISILIFPPQTHLQSCNIYLWPGFTIIYFAYKRLVCYSEVKRSLVMSIGKFGPTAFNLGYDFQASAALCRLLFSETPYRCWSKLLFISSVRSSNSHPDLLVITTTPLFQITPVLNTGLSLSEPLQLYKGYNAI